MNITEFLMIAAAIVPDRTAVIYGDQQFTFQDLQERVNRLANAMSKLGIGPGDRVAAMQTNCNHLLEVYFAAAQLDAIYVPINFRAKEDELATMLGIAEPALLVLGERYLPLVPADGSVPNERVVMLDCPAVDGRLDYQTLLGQGDSEQLQFPEGDEDVTTVIMFTSGTTSIPKGVQLTHDSFGSFLLNNVTPADPDIEETNLLTVPMYHVAGLQAALAAVFGGRTLVVMPQFEPETWMSLVAHHRVNRAMLVPTMLKRIIDHPKFADFDLSSLDVITYGAAPMPVQVIREAIARFPGARFINAFGQTETASTITMLPPEDHVMEGTAEEIETKLKRLASIGKPLDDVEVMIVSEHGEPSPPGEVGEIVARGPRMMSGYWKQAEATAETVRSGWLYTGDLAWQDEDGYIYLAGRAKDFIKRGGEMISPEEVEQSLMEHPAIEEAAVIGVPDLEWGEEVMAVVVCGSHRISEAQVMEYCRDRLSGFKRPRSVVFVDALPRNAMGKVMKRDLREEFGSPVS
jgi:acyl-CoA synthetase (AMP-forming)/AMP-acid ligase II